MATPETVVETLRLASMCLRYVMFANEILFRETTMDQVYLRRTIYDQYRQQELLAEIFQNLRFYIQKTNIKKEQ